MKSRGRLQTLQRCPASVLWIALLLCGMLLLPLLRADEVYQSVFSELTRHDNRLPGSQGYLASLEGLEKALHDAGLTAYRQTFDTLVPETRQCRLTVNGQDIGPIYALGPTGGANNTAGNQTITGPLVWLGDGSLKMMKGKPVDGSIAVLRFDSPNMGQVFSQGARAILFVGAGSETQWQTRRQFIHMDAELPRLFIAESAARRHGLLAADGKQQAIVSLTTVWKDVTGVNLWVEIPGEAGATFTFDREEAVVLSATFDTFGTVPELNPGQRRAANCALLAEVAVQLSRRPLKRTVFAVFFGSHYFMQDGSRMFYYAVRRGAKGELDNRQENYRRKIARTEARIQALEKPEFFAQDHPGLQEIAQTLDKRLAGKLSALNFDLRQVRISLKALQKQDNLSTADLKTRERLNEERDALAARRTELNRLRRQIYERSITEPETFARLAAEEQRDARRQIREFTQLLSHNATHRKLYSRIGDKLIMGHYDFDFANARDDWTLNMYGIGSQMFYHKIQGKWAKIEVGDYVRHIRSLAEIETRWLKDSSTAPPRLFSAPVESLMLPGLFCIPSERSVPSRVAHTLQIYGYQMMTVGDSLDGDELPFRAQTADLRGLTGSLATFCEALASDPTVSQSCPLDKTSVHSDSVMHFRGEGGLRYLAFARGSTDIEGVPQNAVVFCAPNGILDLPVIAGHSYSAASRIRASGHIFMPLLYPNVPFRPLGFDDGGRLQQVGTEGWSPRRLFYGQGGYLHTPFIPGKYDAFNGTLADATGNSAFQMLYQQSSRDAFAFYTDKTGRFKAFEKDSLLLLGSTPERPLGQGLGLAPPLYAFNALRQCASDYLLLNQERLRILRNKSILNDSLESLHVDATNHWNQAVQAREEKNIPLAVGHEVFAASVASRVSGPLRSVTNDMIRAVVLLLLLTIPFAFVMERLFFSATTIYRQVIGFAAFFLGAFILLYMVHPAFSIASSPLIIFLAFVIILLSVVVITIVMSKFKKEVRAMQGLSTSAHGVASESSTALSAILIGISGMRNRPMKTFLTALTIILLTFAIIVFASFTAVIGVTESYLGQASGAARIELRRFSGLPVPELFADSLASLYGDDWRIFPRQAIFRAPGSQVDDTLVVYRKDTRQWQTLRSLVGINPQELRFNEELAAALPAVLEWAETAENASAAESSTPPLFLPGRTAQTLKLSRGDAVAIGGRAFVFAGTFDPGAVDRMTFLDGARIMPPDFETSQREMGEQEAGGSQSRQNQMSENNFVDPTQFTYYSSRSVGITLPGAFDELERLDFSPGINAVTMYAREGLPVEPAAREIAKAFVGPVTANGSDGVNQFFFSRSIQAAGFSVVIVPLLLGGLIIFNSLLGSIVERRKEIFTYSAMGLAPPDVGALFFAESAVYAVLGGMGGYLFSQVAAKGVRLSGEWGWFVPPEMNFSSLSSVLTIFIVMAVVMISTIYPAIKAGRSANPGVARKWKMPTPAGNEIEFVFPFTVSADDMGGILAFIAEHFDNHGDSSLGSFAAARVAPFKSGNGIGFRAEISLAPFDLGIMQAFTLSSRPSEIEDIDEIVIKLERKSGTRGAWLRGNRVFIDDLREQFLLWRSLPFAAIQHYREFNRQKHA